MTISSFTYYVLILLFNYRYILVITVGELVSCRYHCFAPAHVYFVYLIKTNLTLFDGNKVVEWRASSPMTI